MKVRLIGASVVVAGLAVGGLLAGMGSAAEARREAAPAPMEAVKYKVDNVHSSVVFKIKHMGVSNFYGRFNKIEGEYTWDGSKPETSTISVTIDAGSIDSNSQARDQHLKNADFFNVKEFPEITFKSTGLTKKGEGWELAGDLTLLGKTRPVTAKFVFLGEKDGGERFGYRSGFDAMFSFKRSDFGMNYGVENGALGDEVGIIVGIEGIRQ